MRTKLLSELKQAYEPFKALWNEWTGYAFCGLSEIEIYVMNSHRNNNFEVRIEDFVGFSSHIDIIHNLIKHLNSSYLEFKEWVVIKFQFSILSIARKTSFYVANMPREVVFFKLPMVILPVTESLKNILLKFKKQTLEQLFDSYSDQDFLEPAQFDIIVDFHLSLNESAVLSKGKLLSVCKV